MWCMISLSVTGELKDWLDSLPTTMPGNRQDGFNTLLKIVPPDDILASADRVVTLPESPIYVTDENDQPLDIVDTFAMTMRYVQIIGRELLAAGNVVILGSEHAFKAAYATPHWRLWAMMYDNDNDPRFIADREMLGLPEVTMVEARQIIAQELAT